MEGLPYKKERRVGGREARNHSEGPRLIRSVPFLVGSELDLALRSSSEKKGREYGRVRGDGRVRGGGRTGTGGDGWVRGEDRVQGGERTGTCGRADLQNLRSALRDDPADEARARRSDPATPPAPPPDPTPLVPPVRSRRPLLENASLRIGNGVVSLRRSCGELSGLRSRIGVSEREFRARIVLRSVSSSLIVDRTSVVDKSFANPISVSRAKYVL